MKNPFPFFPGTMWKDLKQNSILKQLANMDVATPAKRPSTYSLFPRLTSPV